MTIKEYVDKNKKSKDTKIKKVIEYLTCRLEEIADDFGEDSEEYNEYENTELSQKTIRRLVSACTRFYSTMLSSDVDYLICDNLSWKEILNLIETEE